LFDKGIIFKRSHAEAQRRRERKGKKVPGIGIQGEEEITLVAVIFVPVFEPVQIWGISD
jgi:hypothetical protein